VTKARARFSIGIDLGTTNSALAFAPLVGNGAPEILSLPQWESLAGLTEKPTLPSFLYLPEEAVAGHFRGGEVGAGQWIIGVLARIGKRNTRTSRPFRKIMALPSCRRPFGTVSAMGLNGSGARTENLTGTSRSPNSRLSAGDLEQSVCRRRVFIR
jgi:hypothetical protein